MDKREAHGQILQLVNTALNMQEAGILNEETINSINERIRQLSEAMRYDASSLFITGLLGNRNNMSAVAETKVTREWNGRTDLMREIELKFTDEQRRFYNYLRARGEIATVHEIARDLYGTDQLSDTLKESILKLHRIVNTILIFGHADREIKCKAVLLANHQRALAFEWLPHKSQLRRRES